MKTIGLIGGMSWESSAVYYELIYRKVKEILGGFSICKSLLINNFAIVLLIPSEEESILSFLLT